MKIGERNKSKLDYHMRYFEKQKGILVSDGSVESAALWRHVLQRHGKKETLQELRLVVPFCLQLGGLGWIQKIQKLSGQSRNCRDIPETVRKI